MGKGREEEWEEEGKEKVEEGRGRGREGEKGERRGRGRGGKEIQIKVVIIGIVQGWKYRFTSAGVIFWRQEAGPVGAVKLNRRRRLFIHKHIE